ncbi:heavy metal translocating P-type ATPase [Pseudarthrobacter sp. NIBRBAC000502772]|uniref:heavy metal translocating P-type ATPase n=1 Tax=Pseudarthrobacter sp. NIBRBAC000502772 TaxID=2590775 RepID=UPI001131E3CD|nr:heavy metal translocating P-type ATPase [Pseudarthrobacter sp. NIBRBAC000502772]QDG67749.1 heavy metal translocating P-type ATPase [Pseudarthrobacter sp. NIBRBAC000502772]
MALSALTSSVVRFPLVAATLAVGLLVAVLLSAVQSPAAQWTASAYALLVAMARSGSMVKSLLKGRWGIDLLAVTAIASTVAVGEYVASLIIVLMLAGGEALEEIAHGRATRELKSLLERVPQTAHRELPGLPPEDIPAGDVRPGDVLLIKPSEVVPVDGVLLAGTGSFDESTLTGESLPVEHAEGDTVLSGSVNGENAVHMKATSTANDSQYSKIVALVQEAASSRPPVVRLADRYAFPFTILAFALAGTGWYFSQDPARFAQVLVVATPCPLLIAAPVAFLAGTSRAAHSGIIIKNGGTLEQLARVRTAVFDKTGTLTHGRPALQGINVSRAASELITEDRLLQLAASAEQYSSHVLASSVMDAARHRGLDLLEGGNASEHATQGVVANCGDQSVVVGKPDFVRSVTSGFEEAEVARGQLAIYVGIDGLFAGALTMSDPLRDNAVTTLADLRRLGVQETLLLTGDAPATAEQIASQAGIARFQASCLPADKVSVVAGLRERPVMMVGDGVNDAPVLAAADIGVAMGAKGSTAASESADVVIMLDDLSKAALAVDIGQRTVRIALASIWTGILLSIGLMVAAVFGYIPAVAGALLQELVDLATILNALRALHDRRRPNTAAVGGAPAGVAARR